MRRLLSVVILAAILWSGWWFVGSRGVKSGLELWLDARRAEGWVAEASEIAMRGFPNRFDLTVENPTLADPDTGLSWQAPFLQVFALSYKPHHMIVTWPNEQLLTTPYEKLRVTSDKMQGSAVFDPGPDLATDRATIIADAFRVASSQGWWVDLPQARLAARRHEGAETTYDVALDASEARLSEDIRAIFGQVSLPEAVEALKFDATMSFDAPWDRFAIERARPQVTSLDLKLAEMKWGGIHLQAAGQLQVDANGLPTGEIGVRATNWRELLQIAVSTGALPADLAPAVETGLSLLASISGNADTIDAPLVFRNGRMSLGPVPLGPAPVLRIR